MTQEVQNVIVDEDGGADTMAVLAVVLGHPKKFNLLGLTTTYGNTSQAQALRNNGDLLAFLGAPHIPFYPGARGPMGSKLLEGDGAHGENGLGGVELYPTSATPENKQAVDFIIETLKREPPHTVTIIAAGPLTNIAQAMVKNFSAMKRVKQIIIMGGCTEAMPAADAQEIGQPTRQGNITPYAEFNFYMDAPAAHKVMTSGLPIVLFQAGCTQQLSMTPRHEAIIRTTLPRNEAEASIGMMGAPRSLDSIKFAKDPFMHDVDTAVYPLDPSLYTGRYGHITVTVGGVENGKTVFKPNWKSRLMVMERINDPDKVFGHFLTGLKKCIENAAKPQPVPDPKPAG